MSDTLTVYEKCKHGRLEQHHVVESYWEDDWECPGGREIVLRRPDWYGDRPGGDATEPLSVWVEVDDDE